MSTCSTLIKPDSIAPGNRTAMPGSSLYADWRTLAETYDVKSLSEIDWCTQDLRQPFPGLILHEDKKKTIQANCRTAESRRLSPDLTAHQIGGKGEGTIFLLHGKISRSLYCFMPQTPKIDDVQVHLVLVRPTRSVCENPRFSKAFL